MARTIVPHGLRCLLNEKLKQEGWTSVRSFALSTKLASPDAYTVETITRAFCERDEQKGTDIFTLANILRYLNTPMDEIRATLEAYYPNHGMMWSLLGAAELELTTFERLLIGLVRHATSLCPDKDAAILTGVTASLEAFMLMAGIDASEDIGRMRQAIGG